MYKELDGNYIFFYSVCGKLRKNISNRKRQREKKEKREGNIVINGVRRQEERERLCMHLKLQLFIEGAHGRTNPTQTIRNWQQITQNSRLTHTACKYTSCTKPSIRSKTNILTQTQLQFLRVGFWEMKKTTKYSGIPSRGPPPFLMPFILRQLQQCGGLFPNLN